MSSSSSGSNARRRQRSLRFHWCRPKAARAARLTRTERWCTRRVPGRPRHDDKTVAATAISATLSALPSPAGRQLGVLLASPRTEIPMSLYVFSFQLQSSPTSEVIAPCTTLLLNNHYKTVDTKTRQDTPGAGVEGRSGNCHITTPQLRQALHAHAQRRRLPCQGSAGLLSACPLP